MRSFGDWRLPMREEYPQTRSTTAHPKRSPPPRLSGLTTALPNPLPPPWLLRSHHRQRFICIQTPTRFSHQPHSPLTWIWVSQLAQLAMHLLVGVCLRLHRLPLPPALTRSTPPDRGSSPPCDGEFVWARYGRRLGSAFPPPRWHRLWGTPHILIWVLSTSVHPNFNCNFWLFSFNRIYNLGVRVCAFNCNFWLFSFNRLYNLGVRVCADSDDISMPPLPITIQLLVCAHWYHLFFSTAKVVISLAIPPKKQANLFGLVLHYGDFNKFPSKWEMKHCVDACSPISGSGSFEPIHCHLLIVIYSNNGFLKVVLVSLVPDSLYVGLFLVICTDRTWSLVCSFCILEHPGLDAIYNIMFVYYNGLPWIILNPLHNHLIGLLRVSVVWHSLSCLIAPNLCFLCLAFLFWMIMSLEKPVYVLWCSVLQALKVCLWFGWTCKESMMFLSFEIVWWMVSTRSLFIDWRESVVWVLLIFLVLLSLAYWFSFYIFYSIISFSTCGILLMLMSVVCSCVLWVCGVQVFYGWFFEDSASACLILCYWSFYEDSVQAARLRCWWSLLISPPCCSLRRWWFFLLWNVSFDGRKEGCGRSRWVQFMLSFCAFPAVRWVRFWLLRNALKGKIIVLLCVSILCFSWVIIKWLSSSSSRFPIFRFLLWGLLICFMVYGRSALSLINFIFQHYQIPWYSDYPLFLSDEY